MSDPTDNVLVLRARDLRDTATLADNDQIGAHQLTIEAGITYRQLDYWTRCGHLTPCTASEPGSGFVRVYPRTQVALAREMRRLIDAHLVTTPIALVRDTAVQILEHGQAQVGDFTLTPRQEPA